MNLVVNDAKDHLQLGQSACIKRNERMLAEFAGQGRL
jgi:hypothetical protein